MLMEVQVKEKEGFESVQGREARRILAVVEVVDHVSDLHASQARLHDQRPPKCNSPAPSHLTFSF